jgi:hypothetical protein
MLVMKQATANAEDHPAVATNEGSEGGLISASDVANEEFVVRRVLQRYGQGAEKPAEGVGLRCGVTVGLRCGRDIIS